MDTRLDLYSDQSDFFDSLALKKRRKKRKKEENLIKEAENAGSTAKTADHVA